MENDVINAVKRLKRAGDENSRATQKLRDAASTVAGTVEQFFADQGTHCLPRDYCVNVGRYTYLLSPPVADDDNIMESIRYPLYPGSDNPPTPRRVLLDFAKDIANGWLDEVAVWLESRTKAADVAADTILRGKIN